MIWFCGVLTNMKRLNGEQALRPPGLVMIWLCDGLVFSLSLSFPLYPFLHLPSIPLPSPSLSSFILSLSLPLSGSSPLSVLISLTSRRELVLPPHFRHNILSFGSGLKMGTHHASSPVRCGCPTSHEELMHQDLLPPPALS